MSRSQSVSNPRTLFCVSVDTDGRQQVAVSVIPSPEPSHDLITARKAVTSQLPHAERKAACTWASSLGVQSLSAIAKAIEAKGTAWLLEQISDGSTAQDVIETLSFEEERERATEQKALEADAVPAAVSEEVVTEPVRESAHETVAQSTPQEAAHKPRGEILTCKCGRCSNSGRPVQGLTSHFVVPSREFMGIELGRKPLLDDLASFARARGHQSQKINAYAYDDAAEALAAEAAESDEDRRERKDKAGGGRREAERSERVEKAEEEGENIRRDENGREDGERFLMVPGFEELRSQNDGERVKGHRLWRFARHVSTLPKDARVQGWYWYTSTLALIEANEEDYVRRQRENEERAEADKAKKARDARRANGGAHGNPTRDSSVGMKISKIPLPARPVPKAASPVPTGPLTQFAAMFNEQNHRD